jgi:hypothetical protein
MGPIGVLIVIGLIGYAIVTFIWKQLEQANQHAQGRVAEQPRQPSNEIDRFLQEIDRLRKRREAEEAAAARPASPPPPPARPQQQRPQPQRQQQRPRPTERGKPVPVLAAVPPPPASTAFVEPAALAAPVSTAMLEGDAQAPAVVIRAVQRSAAAEKIIVLLRNPQTLRAAFLLREVLDRPRSARRS